MQHTRTKHVLSILFFLAVFLSFPLLAKASSGQIIDMDLTNRDIMLEEEQEIIEEYIFIYIPEGYSETKKYKTLYIFEGLNSTDNDALDSYGIKRLESLISSGMEELIIVIVPHQVYKSHPFDEIIQTVDEKFSTDTKSSGRIIAGFSNGAYYIWNTVLTNKTYFSLADNYIPMSPIGAKKAISGNFFAIRKSHDRIKVYNSCGNEGVEENYRDFYAGTEQMDMIIKNGEKYGYKENVNIFRYQAEGGHDWRQCWNVLSEFLPEIFKNETTSTNNDIAYCK